MPQQFANSARSRLAASLSDSATSLVVEAASADLFPIANVNTGAVPSSNDWFKAVLQDSSGLIEIVYVRTRAFGSGVCSNVIRGQEGTTALAFPAGTVIGLRLTAADLAAATEVYVPPAGLISLWYGSIANIPAGYALCDGDNGTPDLRSRFIVGAGSTYAVAATGGSANAIVVEHTHTGTTGGQSANASHSHTFSGTTSYVGNHTHSQVGVNQLQQFNQGGAGWSSGATANTGGAGAHDHTYSGTTSGVSTDHNHSFTTASTGSSGTNANLPPYYALAYIMKL